MSSPDTASGPFALRGQSRRPGPRTRRLQLSLQALEPRILLSGDDLLGINDWAYQLQGPDGEDLDLGPLSATDYDLFVIDYSRDGSEDGAFAAGDIAALQDGGAGNRTVLAYLSIGEAEDYRFYWHAIDPGLLGPANPDWPGNYPVRYWEPGWQEIIVSGNEDMGASYLDRVIDAGFDGVYLDLFDAFEYWGPTVIGGTGQRPTAATDMIGFAESIATHARETRGESDFLVFVQNGSNVIDPENYPVPTLPPGITPEQEAEIRRDRLFEAIDGIGAEDTFHYGDLDHNNPLDVQHYTAGFLDQFAAAGELVLSVEYLSPHEANPHGLPFPDVIDDYYVGARGHDYVPLATVRDLDEPTVNPSQPPDPPSSETPGDRLSDALVTDHDGSDRTLTYSYAIGDNPHRRLDVDLYQVDLDDAGDTLIADIDAWKDGDRLDSVLRVFDASGDEVAFNDDAHGLDSFIEWRPHDSQLGAGTYYVGVSSYANFHYDPLVAGSGLAGWSRGPYDLTLEVLDGESGPPDAPGDTLFDALFVAPGPDAHSHHIGDGQFGALDVDLFGVNAAGESVLIADVDAWTDWSSLDSILRVLDDEGRELAANDDAFRAGLDSYIECHVPAAGTYYVGVSGFDNFDYDPTVPGSGSRGSAGPYSLTIELYPIDSSIAPDRYEPNDDFAQAFDFGVVEGEKVASELTIHSETDEDFFQFATTATGTDSHYVAIDFSHDDGDLALSLYDRERVRIDRSWSVTDGEHISLAGLAAGTYYVRVDGSSGDTSHWYELAISAPVPEASIPSDRYEPNNGVALATDLGAIQGHLAIDGLTIHSATDEDFFEFQTRAVAGPQHQVAIDFAHDDGDLDLYLYDRDQVEVGRSGTVADGERIPLDGLGAGTYYLRVDGYAGAISPSYELTVSAPLSSIGPDAWEGQEPIVLDRDRTVSNLTIHAGDRDTFVFTTVDAGTDAHHLQIQFAHAVGDLDLRLYDSAALDNLVASSASETDDERILLAGLAAGMYYAIVEGATELAASPYALTIRAPFEGSDPLDWAILAYLDGDNNLEEAVVDDLNEMEAVALPPDIQVAVLVDRIPSYDTSNGNWTDTRVGVIQHDTNTRVISSSLESWGERNVGHGATLSEFIAWGMETLPAENYALILWDHGAATYGAVYDDTSHDDALSLAELRGALAAAPDHIDVLGFDACLMATVEVMHAVGDYVDYFVASEETEGFDGWDYTDLFRDLTRALPLTPRQFASETVESARDDFAIDTLSAADARSDALTASLSDFVDTALDNADPADWDRIASARNAAPGFYLDEFRDLGGFMTEVASGVADASIASAANEVLDALEGTVVSNYSTRRKGGTGLTVYLPAVGESVYDGYSQLGFAVDTRWDDFLQALTGGGQAPGRRPISRDSAESNDYRATAFDLHELVGPGHEYRDLTIHNSTDHDWFRFATGAAGERGDDVQIRFRHADGDVDLYLYDQQGLLLGSSESLRDVETVSLRGQPSGTYFVQVLGWDGATNPEYVLGVNAPTPTVAPQDLENDTMDKAGEIPVDGVLMGLSMTDGDVDWYHFTCTKSNEGEVFVEAEYPSRGGDLDLALYDGEGLLLASSSGAESGAVICYRGPESDEYYLRVTGSRAGESVPYSLYMREGIPSEDLWDDAAQVLRYVDADGDLVTVWFSGAGQPVIARASDNPDVPLDIQTIEFVGTDASSRLAIRVQETGTVPGDGTDVDRITGRGLGLLDLPDVDVVGDAVDLAGRVGSLLLHDIGDRVVVSIGGDAADLIVYGDLAGVLNVAGDLGRLDAHQGVSDSATITIAGDLGEVRTYRRRGRRRSIVTGLWSGGDVRGAVTIGGNALKIDVDGQIQAPVSIAGNVDTIDASGGTSADGTITVTGDLGWRRRIRWRGRRRWVTEGLSSGSDVGGAISVGGHVWKIHADGHIQAPVTIGASADTIEAHDVTGAISVGGDARSIHLHGQIQAPVVIGGNVDMIDAGRGTSANGTIAVTGDLGAVWAYRRRGRRRWVTTGLQSGGDVRGAVTVGGKARKIDVDGQIQAPLRVGGNVDTIAADRGTSTEGTICIAGDLGSRRLIRRRGRRRWVTEGLRSDGHVKGDISVGGTAWRIDAQGDLGSADRHLTVTSSGDIHSLRGANLFVDAAASGSIRDVAATQRAGELRGTFVAGRDISNVDASGDIDGSFLSGVAGAGDDARLGSDDDVLTFAADASALGHIDRVWAAGSIGGKLIATGRVNSVYAQGDVTSRLVAGRDGRDDADYVRVDAGGSITGDIDAAAGDSYVARISARGAVGRPDGSTTVVAAGDIGLLTGLDVRAQVTAGGEVSRAIARLDFVSSTQPNGIHGSVAAAAGGRVRGANGWHRLENGETLYLTELV